MVLVKVVDEKLNNIHSRRLNHALSQIFFRLMELQNPQVDKILGDYQCTIILGPVVGVEYPPYARQVMEKELLDYKNSLKSKKNSSNKKKR